jgi:N-acetylmuramoyl-L-alanine amidase
MDTRTHSNAEPVESGLKRPVRLIVIHCSGTPNERTLFYCVGTRELRTPVDEIDSWHHDRGFRRSPVASARFNPGLRAIGYHYVIARNGALLTGRHPDEVGAHAKGHNGKSIGVCLIGTDSYTAAQWATLAHCVPRWCEMHGVVRRFATHDRLEGVCGHRDLPLVAKTCPGFNVADWLRGGMQPLAAHTSPEVTKK